MENSKSANTIEMSFINSDHNINGQEDQNMEKVFFKVSSFLMQ